MLQQVSEYKKTYNWHPIEVHAIMISFISLFFIHALNLVLIFFRTVFSVFSSMGSMLIKVF